MKAIDEAARPGVWEKLQSLAGICGAELSLADALGQVSRFEHLSLQAPHVLLDCSKSFWDEAVLKALLQLAREAGLAQRRDALYECLTLSDL